MLKFPLCDDATTPLPAQMFVAVPTPYGLEQLGRIICRCERATPASKQELVRRIRMSTFQVHFRIIFNSFSHHLRIACPCRLAGRCLPYRPCTRRRGGAASRHPPKLGMICQPAALAAKRHVADRYCASISASAFRMDVLEIPKRPP